MALLAPYERATWAQAMEALASALQSQVSALARAAAERGLTPGEQEWLLALTDRATIVEGQRVRLVLAALASEHLTVEQRSAIIQSLTGVTPAMPALAAAVEGKP